MSRRRATGLFDEANNKYHNAMGKGKQAVVEGKEKIKLKLTQGTQLCLHGTLIVGIRKAIDIPDMDNKFGIKFRKWDVTDAYVEVRLNDTCLARANVAHNSLNPIWNETYRFDVCHTDTNLTFRVLDKDDFKSEEIGTVEFKIKDLLDGKKREGEYPIRKESHVRDRGKLKLMVKFTPILENEILRCTKLLSMGYNTYKVDSYFPVRQNCRVTLYQDTHVEENMKQFENVEPLYYPKPCWSDIYNSLMEAKKLIVVVGWSMWHEVKLLRSKETDEGIDERSLGDILVARAQEGVTVYVMLWEEYTGGSFGEKIGTSMGTGGLDTHAFFQKAGAQNIHCILVPRTKTSEGFYDNWFVDKFQNVTYSHHQKTVLCDTSCTGSDRRRLIAYLGGLDLTKGRWDTPNHELFSTLANEHKGDFMNAMIHPKASAHPNIESQGPREPWHDIHCKVEGKIAYDVFCNFRERWNKQGKKDGNMDLDFLTLDLDFITSFDLDDDGTEDSTHTWNCQLFRSINEDSAIFGNSTTNYCHENGTSINKLSRKSGVPTESSILQAYIQMIRSAENFIYIENQYFLGSSHCWKLHGHEKHTPNKICHHIIPVEIAMKIVEKIHSETRFVAYILVPMFPEGDPTTSPVQEILHWQHRTMEMMYEKVSEAIKEAKSDTIPTDWLVFMCLGKQELFNDLISVGDSTNAFARSSHFPIYVHSKMMIVDDSYIIVGSANLNQRSMSGSRDSEIAVGAWQPSFSYDHPKGAVHNFRLGLFREHFNHFDETFIHPEDLISVRNIKDIIRCNWAIYTGNLHDSNLNWSVLKGKPHGNMLPYPIEVKSDGTLETINDVESFPDYPSDATIKGKISNNLMSYVTS